MASERLRLRPCGAGKRPGFRSRFPALALFLAIGWLQPASAGTQAQACMLTLAPSFLAPEFNGAVGDLEQRLEALGGADPERVALAREALLTELVGRADLLLADWATLGSVAQRGRAELFSRLGEETDIQAVLELLPLTRDLWATAHLLAFLSRPEFPVNRGDGRAPALGHLVRFDVELASRSAALDVLEELARAGDGPAVNELLALAQASEGPIAVRAARAVARAANGRDLVKDAVRREFRPAAAGGARVLSVAVLAVWLREYGRILAESGDSRANSEARAPLVLGLRHPALPVRAAALAGFEGYVDRLRSLGQVEAARRALELFAGDGIDSRAVGFELVRVLWFEGLAPERALEALRELARGPSAPTDPYERAWRARAEALEGLLLTLSGKPDEASELLDAAAERMDGVLAERLDLREERGARSAATRFDDRAQLELYRAFLALVKGASPIGSPAFEHLTAAHRFALEGQRAGTLRDQAGRASLDSLFDAPFGLRSLLFAPAGSIAPRERIALLERLLQGLAVLCPGELPGIRAPEAARDVPFTPHEDPVRGALLVGILQAELAALQRQVRLARRRLVRDQKRGDAERALQELRLLDRRRAFQMSMAPEDVRTPSAVALVLGRQWLQIGRTHRARELARAFLVDLEESGFLHQNTLGLDYAIQASTLIGATYTEEDEPLRAEEELLSALERLEDLETTMRAREFGAESLVRARLRRSALLVSLAVNANVKLGDKPKALEYFERAFELRQDDFMRVLLACYRARSGREEEARRVLGQVTPSRELYYNIACTYALLGDLGPALEYLRLEFESNHTAGSPGLARQKVWARGDPDLASLREDPRFSRLVGD